MNENKRYPTPSEFLLNIPLYDAVEFDEENLTEGEELYYFNESLDAYCPDCKEHSIFRRENRHQYVRNGTFWSNKGRFEIELICSRNDNHKLFFLFQIYDKCIQKIGQLPSVADLNLYDVGKYSKVLSASYFKELKTAIGLAAHGVGVGSFVYLRRIFEFLIEEVHQNCKSSKGWNEDAYLGSKTREKIKILKSNLPPFLVENKSIHSILSKGIHDLSEEECLDAFPVVNLGIQIILDSKIEEFNKAKKIEEAKKAISILNSKI